MSVRTVDTSQYQRRTDSYDFDMTIDLWAQALSPGNEQREFWGLEGGRHPGRPQLDGHQGSRDRPADRADRRRARPREPLVPHALPRPRVAVAHVPHSAVLFGKELDRLLEPLRHGRRRAAKYRAGAFDTWWVDEAKDKDA
jgi:hypothetical protein